MTNIDVVTCLPVTYSPVSYAGLEYYRRFKNTVVAV